MVGRRATYCAGLLPVEDVFDEGTFLAARCNMQRRPETLRSPGIGSPPMAISCKQFMTHLTRSGVMSADDLTEFVSRLPTPPADGEQLAKALVKAKRLTAFQAQRIYQGKFQGLQLADYLILDTIGAGGMGQVYLAEHRRMGRRVALKTLPPAMAKRPINHSAISS